MIRHADLCDVPALLSLEERCFPTDRLSRRSLRRFARHDTALMLVDERANRIAGYGLVLFRGNSRGARLYSFAVDRDFRGVGIADALLDACEQGGIARGMERMRLEVREDNSAALRLYTRHGYRLVAEVPAYYEDRGTALRMEKELVSALRSHGRCVPSVLTRVTGGR